MSSAVSVTPFGDEVDPEDEGQPGRRVPHAWLRARDGSRVSTLDLAPGELVQEPLKQTELVGPSHEVPGKQGHPILFLRAQTVPGALRAPGVAGTPHLLD